MVADASIYGLLRQPQPMADPMEQFGRAMTIKNLMGQGRMQDMQMAEAQRAVEEEGRIRDLFASNPKPTAEQVMAVSPKRGMEYGKSLLEAQGKEAEIASKRMEILSKGVGMLKDRLPTVRDEASYQAYRETAASLLGPDMVSKLNLPASYDPNWVRNQVVKAEELFTPKPQVVEMPDGSKQTIDMNPFTNPQAVRFQAAAAMKPAERARLGELQAHNTEMERQGAERLRFDTGVTLPARQVTIGQPTVAPAATQPAPALTPKQQQEMAMEEAKRSKDVSRTVNMYVAARNGLLKGLAGSETGPVAGRMPAVTSAQQVAEGGVSAMAPVLKQLFRVAGEGTFTDKDQELLLSMVPTRKDSPEARLEKMANIDRIVSAKLGMEVPQPPDLAAKPDEQKPIRIAGDDGYNALPSGALFIGPDGKTRRKP